MYAPGLVQDESWSLSFILNLLLSSSTCLFGKGISLRRLDFFWVAKISLDPVYIRIYRRDRKVKSLSCVRLCDPVDCRPPGSSVHGISQARILEWVAISISRDLSNPGIEPGSPALQADTLTSEPPGKQASSNSLMGLRLLLFCNLSILLCPVLLSASFATVIRR